jgi:sec-independent protein translocase protein TatA
MPSGWEWIIVLLIVILIFGIGRISKVGEDLGKGIRAFRKGLSGDEEEKEKKEETKDKS